MPIRYHYGLFSDSDSQICHSSATKVKNVSVCTRGPGGYIEVKDDNAVLLHVDCHDDHVRQNFVLDAPMSGVLSVESENGTSADVTVVYETLL